jgi:hypothetical protein
MSFVRRRVKGRERIVLELSGPDDEGGRVALNVFVEELQSLSAALNRADVIATGGRLATVFEIAALSYNSPPTIELEARVRPRSPDVRARTARILREALAAAEANTLVEQKIDYELLLRVRRFIEPVGTKLRSVSVSVDNYRFEVTRDYVRRIDDALAFTDSCYGTIDGMLEQINVHAGANAFTIYPLVGAPKVACHFNTATREKALSAIGRRVEVTGLMQYRADATFPHQIDVQNIDILPSVEDLPNLRDLRGLAPDATGSVSSEDYVAELRSAW